MHAESMCKTELKAQTETLDGLNIYQ